MKPVSNLVATASANGVDVHWTPPTGETVAGYHIYRADSLQGDFIRVNSNLITGTAFTDAPLTADSALYMVRAVKLETSGSGSYWNLSLGTMVWSSFDPCANAPFQTDIFPGICEGETYVFQDSTYSLPGTYEYLLASQFGCDDACGC